MGGFIKSVALTATTLSCLSRLSLAVPTTSPLVSRDEGEDFTVGIRPVEVGPADEGEESGTAAPSRPDTTGKLHTFTNYVVVESADEICESDPQLSNAWEDSGASDLMNDYIVEYGNGTSFMCPTVLLHLRPANKSGQRIGFAVWMSCIAWARARVVSTATTCPPTPARLPKVLAPRGNRRPVSPQQR